MLFQTSALPDGLAAVGNFDDDPDPELVVVWSGDVYLLEHNLLAKWGPRPIPGGGRGGPPTVADFDGDGQPEIGVAGRSSYAVLETDGTVKWRAPTQDFGSNATGSSVFDFEGDGAAEVVYRDELHLRILRGSDGQVLYVIPMSSATWHEYAFVADVDNDGQAEIVAVANQNDGLGPQNGIYVIGDANDTWVPTRRIWNQHTYHINNVTDDGTMPTHEEPSWLTHNTYRLDAQPAGLSPHSAPEHRTKRMFTP